MNAFYIAVLTLIIYSLISTVVFVITKENEDVLAIFGLGIVGLVLLCITNIIYKIKNKLKYHINKRSIFEEVATGNKYKCKVSDSHNVDWVPGYRLVKRYASRSEYIDIPDFSKDFIEKSRKNCDNCKYNKECDYNYPRNTIKCKNDYGIIIEFDKFEKK